MFDFWDGVEVLKPLTRVEVPLEEVNEKSLSIVKGVRYCTLFMK